MKMELIIGLFLCFGFAVFVGALVTFVALFVKSVLENDD